MTEDVICLSFDNIINETLTQLEHQLKQTTTVYKKTANHSLKCITFNDVQYFFRRLPTNEDPPPYEVVIADQCLPDSPDTFDIVRITHRWQDELVTTSEGSVASPSNGSEPPSYEEYMKRVSEAQNDT